MSFNTLKKNSAAAINKLVSAAEKIGEKKSYGDDSFWAPTVDKAGNGYAVIRFLPTKEGEDLPWVQYWDHGFKGSTTGRWYIENSLTTLGQNDPVSEANTVLWNSGNDDDKALARERKRRLHYVSNILVISDSSNPENDGKQFKYKYGKKIYDKIIDVMQPQFADEKPVNPFDFWAGANFKLKIRNVEGYRNYDKSEFDSVSALFDGDEKKLEAVYDSLYALADIVAPANFKTYAELKTKFNAVIGQGEVESQYSTAERVSLEDTLDAVTSKTVSESEPASVASSDSDGEDDTLGYFAQLAQKA
jgi:hypothetical protein